MKRRSCRRTMSEEKMHEKAVKVRKMTDEQLVNYIEDRVEKARSEGRNEGLAKATPQNPEHGADKFLEFIQKEKIQGIGAVTVNKLMKVERENGFVQ